MLKLVCAVIVKFPGLFTMTFVPEIVTASIGLLVYVIELISPGNGGKGTRIKKLIGNIPKPLAKFNKIKFLDYLLNFYCKFNINNID